jgi:hypothetical protein
MASEIKDGAGAGYGMKVDAKNRAHTESVSVSEGVSANKDGDSYNLNTGLISITADATLLYLKNNEDKDLLIEAIALGSFEGITHSDDPYITVSRNPTGGDLISDATAIAMNENRNFGSNNTLAATVYKGKVGGTVTGGDNIEILQVAPGQRSFYTIDFLLKKGNSIAVELTANVSSDSANYYIALICYLKDPTL